MQQRLRRYVQYRYRCVRCGDYEMNYFAAPRHPKASCHWCGGDGLIHIGSPAVCQGPWFTVMGPSRPRKSIEDWITGGIRNNGKSTGRPKKVQPGAQQPDDPGFEGD